MNRKNGKLAADDINESQRTGAPSEFIAQVAAISCAETQQPDTTSADQRRRNVGLRNEDQMEVFAVTRIGIRDCYSNLSDIEMNVHLGPSFAGHIAFVRDRVIYMRRRLVTGACPHDRISHTVCVARAVSKMEILHKDVHGVVACKNVRHAFSNIQELPFPDAAHLSMNFL